MITTKAAIEFVKDLSSEEIQELVERILRTGLGGIMATGHDSSPAEDLVIQLLKSSSNEHKEIWQATLAGCQNILGDLFAWLARPNYEHEAEKWSSVFIRITRVIDVCGPHQLMEHANAILNLVLGKGDNELLSAAVRACAHYRDSSLLPTWERVIAKEPHVAAYAFNALLDINPNSTHIEKYLIQLWDRQVQDEWPVDCAFLMRRAAKIHGHTFVVHLLAMLDNENHWDLIKIDLNRRKWSREWLEGWALRSYVTSKTKRVKEESVMPFKSSRKLANSSVTTKVTHFDYGAKSPKEYLNIYVVSRNVSTDLAYEDEIYEKCIQLAQEGRIEFEESTNRDVSKEISDAPAEGHTDGITQTR